MSGQEDSEQRALAGAADGAGVTVGVDQLDCPEHPIAHVHHATTRTETPCDSRAMWCDPDATVVRCPPVIVDRMRTEQHLVTGWERHLDVADTLLRRFVFHLAALDAAFTLAGCGRTLDADDVSMADLGRPGGYFNGAVLMRPPADWNDSLATHRAFRRRRSRSVLLVERMADSRSARSGLAALGPSAAPGPPATVDVPGQRDKHTAPRVQTSDLAVGPCGMGRNGDRRLSLGGTRGCARRLVRLTRTAR